MSKLSDNLKQLQDYASNLEKAKRAHVAVGLPKEKVGGKIYGDGITIVRVGVIHEFTGRSFLRVPFQIKSDEINDFISKQFTEVFSGKPVDKIMGLVGIKARNISVGAFTTQGYGTWAPNSPATIKAKGSSQPLIDTVTLRNSINYVARGL